MMLRHIGAIKGAEAIENAVRTVLINGFRTGGSFLLENDDPKKLLGTSNMGKIVLSFI